MAGNDVSAFEAVFQKHFADIYGYVAFRLAPRIEDARDLTQYDGKKFRPVPRFAIHLRFAYRTNVPCRYGCRLVLKVIGYLSSRDRTKPLQRRGFPAKSHPAFQAGDENVLRQIPGVFDPRG